MVVGEDPVLHHAQRQHLGIVTVAPDRDVELGAVDEIFDKGRALPGLDHVLDPVLQLLGIVDHRVARDAERAVLGCRLDKRRVAPPAVEHRTIVDLGDRRRDAVLEQQVLGLAFVLRHAKRPGVGARIGEAEFLEHR
ncbi:MAG TPA: hypothetical protein PK954_14900, partial [Anaerolineales bacterium]|nr:hypothetical protein [Anaerolineales bacterium]